MHVVHDVVHAEWQTWRPGGVSRDRLVVNGRVAARDEGAATAATDPGTGVLEALLQARWQQLRIAHHVRPAVGCHEAPEPSRVSCGAHAVADSEQLAPITKRDLVPHVVLGDAREDLAPLAARLAVEQPHPVVGGLSRVVAVLEADAVRRAHEAGDDPAVSSRDAAAPQQLLDGLAARPRRLRWHQVGCKTGAHGGRRGAGRRGGCRIRGCCGGDRRQQNGAERRERQCLAHGSSVHVLKTADIALQVRPPAASLAASASRSPSLSGCGHCDGGLPADEPARVAFTIAPVTALTGPGTTTKPAPAPAPMTAAGSAPGRADVRRPAAGR